jgi:hypothetical protein
VNNLQYNPNVNINTNKQSNVNVNNLQYNPNINPNMNNLQYNPNINPNMNNLQYNPNPNPNSNSNSNSNPNVNMNNLQYNPNSNINPNINPNINNLPSNIRDQSFEANTNNQNNNINDNNIYNLQNNQKQIINSDVIISKLTKELDEIKQYLNNQPKQIDISLYETIIKKLNTENIYYEQQIKKLIEENTYLRNNNNINNESEEYKKEIENKIIELETIKKETILETMRLKDENDKITKNIESQNKLKIELESMKNNVLSVINSEKNIVLKEKITNLDIEYNNISSIELTSYDLPNIINNINNNNNFIKLLDNNNNEYLIKINNGYYTNKNICKELNNNQYYNKLGLKFNLDNSTQKISIKSNNNITLLWSNLLELLGYNNDDNILKNNNNIIASNKINLPQASSIINEKILYIYILELNKENPIFQIVLNSNKVNFQKVDLYPYINHIDKLTIEFRDNNNKIIEIDNFLLNIIIKCKETVHYQNKNLKDFHIDESSLHETKNIITNEQQLYDKLIMSYC